ncbi:MAG TPA: PHB depolymerase family esterase [Trueperaceae bacterium]
MTTTGCKRLPVLVPLLLAWTLCLGQQAPGSRHEEMVVDAVARTYELYVPPGAGTEAGAAGLPLLVVLHGRGGSGAGIAAASGFNELAQAVVVYPDGLGAQWNYLAGIGANQGVDDVRFLHALVERMSDSLAIDPDRVYVAGYSNGGFMVQRLACESDSPFRAFASVAGAGFEGLPMACEQARPLSMMLVHGTADQVVPWAGQTGVFGGREIVLSASVPQTFGFWANQAGCGGASERNTVELDGTNVERVEVLKVTDCPAGNEVVLYALVGGDHDWLRLVGNGEARMGFDVSREILGFFGVELR